MLTLQILIQSLLSIKKNLHEMRTKDHEIRKSCNRRKKLKKMENKYETLMQNSPIGGSSFIVEDGRMPKWRKLMHIRYFVHLGKRDDISVNYKVATDHEGVVIAER